MFLPPSSISLRASASFSTEIRIRRIGSYRPFWTVCRIGSACFVGFEDEPFIDDIVQLSAFDALAEDEEEADVEECGQGDDK